jgi:hypothetical protein
MSDQLNVVRVTDQDTRPCVWNNTREHKTTELNKIAQSGMNSSARNCGLTK